MEITDRCNFDYPICYADSGAAEVSELTDKPRNHRSLAEIELMLDAVVRNEVEPDIVQLSGGATLHPQFSTTLVVTVKQGLNYVVRIEQENYQRSNALKNSLNGGGNPWTIYNIYYYYVNISIND